MDSHGRHDRRPGHGAAQASGAHLTLSALTIGIPALFLVIRLLLHAFVPKWYGPAGGFGVFSSLVAGVLYVFAFIAAAVLGATAGCKDVDDGMFRQLVVTGRSRVALYLARIPAGLAIVVPMVALAFTVIGAVCAFSAPKTFDFQGTTVPLGLSRTGYQAWAVVHPDVVICDLPFNGPCPEITEPSPPLSRAQAVQGADLDYPSYAASYVSPPVNLMIRTGLWLELEVAVALVFGLGLASLMGERTLPIVVMIVYTVIFRPFLLALQLPHLVNFQRIFVELAIAHLEPGGVGFVGSVAGGPGLVGHVQVAARVDDRGGDGRRRLAGGVDGARCLAHGDQRRLRGSTDWASLLRARCLRPEKSRSRHVRDGA